jgi:hypothetical protein
MLLGNSKKHDDRHPTHADINQDQHQQAAPAGRHSMCTPCSTTASSTIDMTDNICVKHHQKDQQLQQKTGPAAF